MSTTSAVSIATSVPAPIAIPRSARASAGASFTPSPTIATFFPAPSSSTRLVAREHLADHRLHAELIGDPSSRGLVVSREHDHLDARFFQGRDGGGRRLLWCVGDADQRDLLAAHGNADHRAPGRGQVFTTSLQRAEIDPLPVHQADVADRDAVTLDRSNRAVTRDVLEVVSASTRDIPRVRILDHGLREGMLRLPLDGGRETEDLIFRHAVRDDVGYLRFALREGAGLVHHHGIDPSRGLEGNRVLEQDPPLRPETGPHHDRGRRR